MYISTECRFFDLDLRQIRHVTFPKDQVRGAHSLAPPPPASSRLRAASSARYPSRCTPSELDLQLSTAGRVVFIGNVHKAAASLHAQLSFLEHRDP